MNKKDHFLSTEVETRDHLKIMWTLMMNIVLTGLVSCSEEDLVEEIEITLGILAHEEEDSTDTVVVVTEEEEVVIDLRGFAG